MTDRLPGGETPVLSRSHVSWPSFEMGSGCLERTIVNRTGGANKLRCRSGNSCVYGCFSGFQRPLMSSVVTCCLHLTRTTSDLAEDMHVKCSMHVKCRRCTEDAVAGLGVRIVLAEAGDFAWWPTNSVGSFSWLSSAVRTGSTCVVLCWGSCEGADVDTAERSYEQALETREASKQQP